MQCREQLFHLLAEAAELEHNILCSYLYAVFSLKQHESEDLTPRELAVVNGWRDQLMGLCIEEMVHLAQVSNLLVAVGARPHFNRPNLPVAPGYHPADIVIKLAPLDLETLDHFIYLERPEEAQLGDSAEFIEDTADVPRPVVPPDTLMPHAPQYATIGAFYQRLREGLERAAVDQGEARLFCGPADMQLQPQELKAPELVVVTDLASARNAIEFIVVQGEGSSGERESSHFQRFQEMRQQFVDLREARPAFVPHRPVARNPVMHPPQHEDRVHVNGRRAAPVLDAANATYSVMLRCLAQLYEVPTGRAGQRQALLGASLAAMKVLGLLATELTTLPAQDGGAVHAGVSFAMLRSTEGLVTGAAARAVLLERFGEITARLPSLGVAAAAIQPMVAALNAAMAALERAG